MGFRKYRYTWEAVASVQADHVKHWGAFNGYRGPVAFNVGGVSGARWEHDAASDAVSLSYAIDGDVRHAAFAAYRQPSPLGGERVLFRAPCCGRHVARLALLAEGLRCGACGLVTHQSKRSTAPARAVRKAELSAARLGLSSWRALPEARPRSMHAATFRRLAAAHAANVELAQSLLARHVEALERKGAGRHAAALVLAGM